MADLVLGRNMCSRTAAITDQYFIKHLQHAKDHALHILPITFVSLNVLRMLFRGKIRSMHLSLNLIPKQFPPNLDVVYKYGKEIISVPLKPIFGWIGDI